MTEMKFHSRYCFVFLSIRTLSESSNFSARVAFGGPGIGRRKGHKSMLKRKWPKGEIDCQFKLLKPEQMACLV